MEPASATEESRHGQLLLVRPEKVAAIDAYAALSPLAGVVRLSTTPCQVASLIRARLQQLWMTSIAALLLIQLRDYRDQGHSSQQYASLTG